MTPEAQRIAIAEACGWTDCNLYEDNSGPSFWNGYPPSTIGIDGNGDWQANKAAHHKPLPNYLTDLNAMHKAEKLLNSVTSIRYLDRLIALNIDDHGTRFGAWHATAAQRAEAFLRTLNLWDDSK